LIWKWSGPLKGGITQSLINKYLVDPYSFVVYYGLGLEEPRTLEPNLIWGNVFHKVLETFLPEQKCFQEFSVDDWHRVMHIIDEELKYYPEADSCCKHSIWHMCHYYNDSYKVSEELTTEIEFQIPHDTGTNKVSLMGKVDVQLAVSKKIIDHKCKGFHDRASLRQEISKDLQMRVYTHATGYYDVIYDIIKIPDTQKIKPPRGTYERASSYVADLYTGKDWGDFPVARKTFAWLDQLSKRFEPEETLIYFKRTINPIIDSICELFEYCSGDGFDIENPDHYNRVFFEKPVRHFDAGTTAKYKPDLYEHRTGKLSLSDLKPVDKIFKELSNNVE